MDTRFVREWRRADSRREEGERFDVVLSSMSSDEIVAALAGGAAEDPVAANAMATAILNRMNRARLLGAFLGIGISACISGVVLLVVDYALTKTIGLEETAPFGLDVAAVGMAALLVAVVALVAAFLMLRRLRARR